MLNFRNHVLRSTIPVIAAALSAMPPASAGSSARGITQREGVPPDTLALVGPRAITGRDLIGRIELMPWPGKESPAFHDTAKIRALQSLVAEELLALEGAAAGIGDEPWIVEKTAEIERVLVRDELYRREIRDRVTVSDADIRTGLGRYGRLVTLVALAARSREDASRLSSALAAQTPPEGGNRRQLEPLILRRDTATISFGRLEEPFEDEAYRLTPEQPASPPLLSPRGEWFVFVFVTAGDDPRAAPGSLTERRARVEQTVRQRREQALARSYMAATLKPHKATVDTELFETLASTMLSVLRSDTSRFRTREGYSLNMVADTVGILLGAQAQRTLVSMEEGGLSLAAALRTYRYFNFVVPSLETRDFHLRLNESLKDVVATDYLAREGYRLGLENSAQVRRGVDLWRRHWVAAVMQDSVIASSSPSPEDVSRYLLREGTWFGRWYEVNIREVLCDSLSGALSVLRRIAEGEPMEAIARAETRRREWAGRGGESGFFRVSDRPALGFAALDADSGRTAGPVVLAEGYSVFTVLGKRTMPGDTVLAYDSLKASATRLLAAGRGKETLDQSLARWARDHGVRIFYNRLKDVWILPSSMVTKRFVGFGGSMLAAPGLVPRWEWMYRSGNLRDLLP